MQNKCKDCGYEWKTTKQDKTCPLCKIIRKYLKTAYKYN